VIAIGAVIRGETAHFDYVCNAASEGILRVGLDTGNPVIFCVLTDDTIEQSRARSGGEHGNKGVEAAVACLQMLDLKSTLYGG
jgi:6,7-dimethyl-8-ribityllumazine synthase